MAIRCPLSGGEWTRRWFMHRNRADWIEHILPRYKTKPVNYLAIGVFEGQSEFWLLDHVFTHPDCKLWLIDPWRKTRKLDQQYMDSVFERCKRNLIPRSENITLTRGFSRYVLQNMACWTDDDGRAEDATENGYRMPNIDRKSLDLAVIDGDHRWEPCLRDAQLVLPLMKPGGWMVFDDVRMKRRKPEEVEKAIPMWLAESGDRVKLVWEGRHANCYQVL